MSLLCGTRIHYELFQVGHNILFPVEPAALNKLHRLTGIGQVVLAPFNMPSGCLPVAFMPVRRDDR
jgi:hypothetical protein